MNVVFAAEAISDLRAIRTYVSHDDPQAASRLAVRIVAACDRLSLYPHRGRPGQVSGTRENVTVRPYVIVYRVRREEVEVLRIWHAAQIRP